MITWWLLLIIMTAVWFAGVAVGLLEWKADKLVGKCSPDAGFTVVPVIPIYPLVFFGLAKLIDQFAWPWGTRIGFWFHIALASLFLAGLIYEMYRIRSARLDAQTDHSPPSR